MQQQFAVASEQTKELFELYTKVTTQAFDSRAGATKIFDRR